MTLALLRTEGETLASRFGSIARACADKPFIVPHGAKDQSLTFGEAFAKAELFAEIYSARGVRPGQIVVLMLPTHRDAASAFLGAILLGAIPAFFPPLTPKQDAAIFWASHGALFDRIKVALIVSDAFNASLIALHLGAFSARCLDIDAAAAQRRQRFVACPGDRGDIAFLQHSSGTTGLKKGVALTHAMVLGYLDSLAEALAVHPEDRVVSWLPLYHDMGLIGCLIAPALLGLTTIVLDPFRWVARPTVLLEAVAAHGATVCWQPNFAFHHIMRLADSSARYDLRSLRVMFDTSEPCKPETLAAFRERFAADGLRANALQVSYGMAEAVFVVTQTPLGAAPRVLAVEAEALDKEGVARPCGDPAKARKLMSCGLPMKGVRIRILGAEGLPCPDRQVGEIAVASESLFEGYYLTETPPGKLEAGWYRSGDFGFMDQGEVFVTGRADDLLIIHGKNIYAHDVEFCVNKHCAVKPGRVVAVAPFNPQTGSQSLVVIAESPDEDTRSHLAQAVKAAVDAEFGLAVFEAMIVAPGWLSKTTSGKISRGANLSRYTALRPAYWGMRT
jgi:acyl-CoA synthetase (AMP-forming)/AMP-acid ligase II